MTASYPSAVRDWTTKRNYLDIVWAEHMNSIQDETKAIQETLGVIPQKATANPGGLTPDHGTVAARIQSVARGEQIPFFRGSVRELGTTQGVWVRPSLRADDDPFGMSTGTGVKLNEAGLWAITLKADFKSTVVTAQQQATRLLRLEVNGADIGVRDVLAEGAHNRAALHTSVTWIETYDVGTTISMGVRTNCGGSPGSLLVNAYMRVHMVRCHPPGGGGSVPFDEIPDEKPEEKPPGNVVTPPDNLRRYTIIASLAPVGGVLDHNYDTGWTATPPGLAVNFEVIDNTHPAFSSSPYPRFFTWAEANAYGENFKRNYWGGNWRSKPSETLTGTGTSWQSI